MSLLRVLFVDDEPNILLTLSAILRQKGFDVTTASSVPAALKLINSEEFEVLISDLNIGEPGDASRLSARCAACSLRHPRSS